MIDTIKIKLSSKHFDHNEMLYIFETQLKVDRETQYRQGSQGYSVHATYKNWNFWLSGNYLKGSGSLAKLQNSNNFHNTSFNEVKAALDQLQDTFKISLSKADVDRIDVGYNLVMDQPVHKYFDLMVTPDSFKLVKYQYETYDFRSKACSLMFYDKVKETGQARLPCELKKLNLLRYELKFHKPLLKKLGLTDLKFHDLYNESNYSTLITEWYNRYDEIPKLTASVATEIRAHSKTAFKDSLCLIGINNLGGIEFVRSLLSRQGVKPKPKCVIKKYLNELQNVIALSPILLQELNSKMLSAYEDQMFMVN